MVDPLRIKIIDRHDEWVSLALTNVFVIFSRGDFV